MIGFTDDESGAGGKDDVVLLATRKILSGEVIYLTNNGWSDNGSSSQFFGAKGGVGTESGSQQLMALTITQDIDAGTILSTAVTGSTSYSWTTSGAINGLGGAASYNQLDLSNDAGFGPGGLTGGGDQIYIFQSTSGSDPMGVDPDQISFIYFLDNGEPLSPGFEDPSDPFLGANVPSPSNVAQAVTTAGFTAVELSPNTTFHVGMFGLDMSSAAIIALQNSGGTPEEWLEAIADSANWSSGSLPSGTFNIITVPEPSRVVLLAGAFGAIVIRRRRPECKSV